MAEYACWVVTIYRPPVFIAALLSELYCKVWYNLALSFWAIAILAVINEPPHDKTIKMACEASEDLDQPGHPPTLIRVFAVRMKKAWVLSYPLSAQQKLWSDWADAQIDLSLRWCKCHFVGFVMRRLFCCRSSMASQMHNKSINLGL